MRPLFGFTFVTSHRLHSVFLTSHLPTPDTSTQQAEIRDEKLYNRGNKDDEGRKKKVEESFPGSFITLFSLMCV